MPPMKIHWNRSSKAQMNNWTSMKLYNTECYLLSQVTAATLYQYQYHDRVWLHQEKSKKTIDKPYYFATPATGLEPWFMLVNVKKSFNSAGQCNLFVTIAKISKHIDVSFHREDVPTGSIVFRAFECLTSWLHKRNRTIFCRHHHTDEIWRRSTMPFGRYPNQIADQGQLLKWRVHRCRSFLRQAQTNHYYATWKHWWKVTNAPW